MTSKWIKLHWMRPKTADYPKIWRTFIGRDSDSDKLTEYRIQDLTESRHDDAIKHMESFYLRDEPVSQVLGGGNDEQYVADYGMICRSIMRQNASLVCLRAGSNKIVGVQTHYVITRADNFGKQAYERCQSPKTRKMYDVDSILTKHFNVFDAYGVSEYLYLHNQAVDERFRGLNIGLQMIEAGMHFCRQSNIKIMHGIFTSDFSSRMADTFGFKQDLAMSLGCGNCNFKKYYRTFNLDMGRSVQHVLLNPGSEMSVHVKEYPGHEIKNLPEDVFRYKNAVELKLAYSRRLANQI